MQLSKGVKEDYSSSFVTLKEDEKTVVQEKTPSEVTTVLEKVQDVMPAEFPKKLHHEREVDHGEELVNEPAAARHVAPPWSTEGVKNLPNEWANGMLNDATNLSEERIDEVLKEFLKDFKEGTWEANGWPTTLTSYILSRATLNAYTRVVAKKFPTILVNCVCSGYVKTSINDNTGTLTVVEGAECFVRLALLPDGGST
ncbi:(+)-neomenthol dehydrogenase-like [Impatiens glandulifera]|uniref:(+)-neomenthol dehydrogenase-like n=1 Tax=Impatiens glandulifera TaxID=253017 RepID=UPI001FB14C3C|nr:(+)-neomenthol dehydrogenase-like [Impatiens glandulifera]